MKLKRKPIPKSDPDDSMSSNDIDLDSSNNPNSSDATQQPSIPGSFHLGSLDNGIIHSGVPTLTTSTLTPTTLRNIEQTFYELTNDIPSAVPCQAGFVAPLPSFAPESDLQDPENSLESTGSSSSDSWQTPPPTMADDASAGSLSTPAPSRRNMGGRRPKHSSNLTPAEEEKRKVRRERNKLAAARCRKRRVDQTNTLVEKVTELEKDKMSLLSEIEVLKTEKQSLEICLDEHRAECRMSHMTQQHQQQQQQQQNNNNNKNNRKSPLEFKQPIPHIVSAAVVADKIKSEPNENNYYDGPPPAKRMMLNDNPIIGGAPMTVPTTLSSGLNMPPVTPMGGNNINNSSPLHTPTIPTRPNRLNFRPIPSMPSLGLHKNVSEMAGVSITTPSHGVFNFDSLMEGGTGLTPVVSQPLMPNCPSPMNRHAMELTTPTTEPSKLLSI